MAEMFQHKDTNEKTDTITDKIYNNIFNYLKHE